MKKLRILIADDHALVRASIRRLIESMEDAEVVGEASDGREVVSKVKLLDPNIVLLDLLMPELNGLDAARQIAAERPDLGIICLTMHSNAEYVRQARKMGARGFILKESSPEEIQRALRAVAAGETWFPTAPLATTAKFQSAGGERLFAVLSPRQREVLQLLAEGNSTRRIAEKMSITEHTVEKHRERIMAALDIHDLAGLVHFALQSGLTQADY